jgi:glycosyltransferase involved in cell wall biosynthesis
VLVQPGANNTFNEFRLPGKLPEFFAMGRPVIVPRSNVGRFVRHGEEAWVLDKVDALGIVTAVLELRGNKELSERLAAGATAFCRRHFNWQNNAGILARFYDEVISKTQEQINVETASASQ